ncbi:hypothetical protein [Hymenobacter profundi]|uniref:DUF1376 domain-containing protein n=1 Tax=Hymenobacter profundi TaxID=1982110 RepID=A0ABS6WZ35_9BACT|nr:hypothetical protein [Hymenobacter profundi]MBW3128857.1 hypothetical protein [Hymenobacter profundi]
MNYISLINQFWAKDLEHSFTPNDIAVYFRLLERCNALGWKNPFNFSVDELLMKLRLKTKDPFTTARNRLKQAGLIEFKNGDGRGWTTQYYLIDPDEDEERDKKNTPLMPPLSPTLSPPLLPPETPLLHKTKLNKTKRKTANAVSAGASGQEAASLAGQSPPGKEPLEGDEPPPPGKTGKKSRAAGRASPARASPANPLLPLAERYAEEVAALSEEDRAVWDRFVAWEQHNPLPKLFQMAEPLRPRQLAALTRRYSPEAVADVLRDMQNKPKLTTQYDSANLTAQSWLKRRQQ